MPWYATKKAMITMVSAVVVLVGVKFAEAQFLSPTCVPPNCNPQVIQSIPLADTPQAANFNITGDGGIGAELQVGRQDPVLSSSTANLIYGNVGAASSAGSLLLLQNGGADVLRVGITGDSTLSGRLGLPAGSATAPALYFGGDANTGFFSSGADAINFTTGGTQAFSVAGDNTVTFAGDVNLTTVSGDGSGLTDINATNITSGTLNNARLSSNVALTDQANTFSALQTYTPNTNEEGIRVISSNYSPLVIRNTADTSDLFRVTENGYVGIALGGAPAYPLVVGGTIYGQGDVSATYLRSRTNGTASNAAIGFAFDTDTGIYRPGTDTIALTAGGSEGLRVTTTFVQIPAGKSLTVGGQTVCLADGTDCPPSEIGGGGTGSSLSGYVARFTGANTIGDSIIYHRYYIGDRFIGINDTAPGYALDVSPYDVSASAGVARFKNPNGTTYVDVQAGSSGNAVIGFRGDSVRYGRIEYDISTRDLILRSYNGQDGLRIDYVNDVHTSYDLNVGGNLDVNGEGSFGTGFGSSNNPGVSVTKGFGGQLTGPIANNGIQVSSRLFRANSGGYTYTGAGAWITGTLISAALADIDTLYGTYSAASQQDNEHAVGTAYGIYGTVNATGSGGITNSYAGYFKGYPSASNNWALYATDGLVQIDDDETPNTPSVADGAGDLYVVGDLEVGGTVTGGGLLTGSGTTNAIPKFTPDGSTLGDSQLSDNGSTVTLTGGNLVATGTFNFGSSMPVSGSGARMMWIPGKAAFRAGNVSGTEWDTVNVGDYSVAFGDRNTASGEASFAVGNLNVASGYNSIAIGETVDATNSGSIAIGQGSTVASGVNAMALGPNSTASGPVSLAFGDLAVASGGNSIALGSSAVASGSYSFAILDSEATASYAVALGGVARANAMNSTAISSGGYATTNSQNSIAMGAAVSTGATGAFTIGRGVSNASPLNNAIGNSLMVGFNSTVPTFYVGPSAGAGTTGDVGIGTSSPTETFHVEGTGKFTTGIGVGEPSAWSGYGVAASGNEAAGHFYNYLSPSVYGALGYRYSTRRYGVYASAIDGTATYNYALYANASGGTYDYSVYAPNGNAYFGDNVGIGTTTPYSQLSFGTSLSHEKINLYESSSTYSYGMGVVSGQMSFHVGSSSANYIFYNSEAVNDPVFAITGGGRIRIDGDSRTEIYRCSTDRMCIRAESTDNIAQFATYGLYLPKTGTSLYIGGTAYIGYSQALSTSGSGWLCASSGTSGYIRACGSSSIRYKENIDELQLGLAEVLQLHPVTFNWKEDGREGFGFVAEEVAEVSDLLVYGSEDHEIEGVHYPYMSALMAKAIQELDMKVEDGFMEVGERLDDHEDRIEELEAKIEALEERIEALEGDAE